MKKLKFILPVLAFVFGVVATFATNFGNESGAVTYKINPPVCEDCDSTDAWPSEAQCGSTGMNECRCEDSGGDILFQTDCKTALTYE